MEGSNPMTLLEDYQRQRNQQTQIQVQEARLKIQFMLQMQKLQEQQRLIQELLPRKIITKLIPFRKGVVGIEMQATPTIK